MSDRPELTRSQSIMRIVVSIAVLAVSFYIILNKSSDQQSRQWAAGWIGLVIGYWLA
jgi:hypothetical protein